MSSTYSLTTPMLADRCGEIIEKIESRRHQHIALLIGSAASCPAPTCCANVWDIRNGMVLDPLAEHVRDGVKRGTFLPSTLSLLEQICDERGTDSGMVPLKWDVESLPFEQFMGCLHKANREVADEVVSFASGPKEHGEPNHNHIGAVLFGARLLQNDLAERVSILTTNYDMGLEQAICRVLDLAAELAPIPKIDEFVPALSAQLPRGKSLQLVKLHGCIKRRRLVYAFFQMGRLVFETERLRGILAELSVGTNYPTLYLSLGYSFSDPDLRPMFLDAFSQAHPLIYRNERPPDSIRDDPDVERKEHLARTGPAILQKEFFAKATKKTADIRVHHSDLYRKDGPAERISLLVRLAAHFCYDVEIPEIKIPASPTGISKRSEKAIQRLTEAQALVFLGGLVDACSRPDALLALKSGCMRPADSSFRAEIVRLYLSQYGHAHRMADAASECVELRRKFQEPEVRLIADSYRSLALSLGPAGRFRWRQAWAALPLMRAWLNRKRVSGKWQVYYKHHALHFRTKLYEIIAGALSSLPANLGHWPTRVILLRLSKQLGACEKAALELESPDLEAAADLLSLQAEVRVLLRDDSVSLADRTRQIRAALGALNRVALVDRQLAWAHLSENTDPSREAAMQALARGLWLGTYSADGSIEPKLAADLVRVVHAGKEKDLQQICEEIESDERAAVRKICRPIGLGERPVSDLVAEDVRRMLVRHLRFLYSPHDNAVLELVRRHTDTARFPIFLAPSPPSVKIRRRTA